MGGPLIRIALALAGLWLATPSWAQEPSPTELAWARVEQVTLPALEGRRASALARAAARQAWFDGTEGASFEQAFPDWAGAPLNRAGALQGALARLAATEVQHAGERRERIPELGPPERAQKLKDAREATFSAEAQADTLERRLLVEALAVLEAQPRLAASQLQPTRLAWEVVANKTAPAGAADEVAVAEAAARADRWLRVLNTFVSDILRTRARGAPLPLVPLDRLQDPVEAPLAAVQIGLLQPLLDAEPAEAADRALTAYWVEMTWPEPVDRAAEAATLQAAITQARESTSWERVRKKALSDRLAVLLPAVGAAAPATPVIDSADVARTAEREADEAQQQADDAMATAADARARRRAEVLQALATARRRSAELWGQAEARQTEAHAVEEQLDESLAAIDNEISAIRNRRMGEAAPDPDVVYRRIRALSQELRGGPVARGRHVFDAEQVAATAGGVVSEDRGRIREAATWVSTTPDKLARAELEAALDGWSQALSEESKAAENLLSAVSAERDAALRGLSRLREQRRVLRGWASASALSEDGSYLLRDVAQELSLLGPSVLMRARDRGAVLLALPGRLMDFNLLRGMLGASLWVLLWVGAWGWARNQADTAARFVADRLAHMREELRPADLAALRDPIARSIRSLTDLLLGWLLIVRLAELSPELGFALAVYLQVALFRALLAAYDLCLVPSTQVRPALLVLRPEPYALARRTYRYFVGVIIARAFIYKVLWDGLGLDVVAGLVTGMFTLAILGLVVWSLHRWEPFLRARVAQRDQSSRAVEILSREPESPLLQPLRGAAILIFFAVAGSVDLAFWLGRERSGLAWLVHAFSRFREPEESLKLPPLAEEVTLRIGPTAGPVLVERPEVVEEVAHNIESWRREGRRGLVALIGDRGACKSHACAQVGVMLAEKGLHPREVVCRRRLVTEAEMVSWLAEVLELEACEDTDDVVTKLLALPQQGLILRNVHRAWTRRVEGFEAFTTLLFILNATSHHHFWVLSLHRLSWEFFASSATLVDVGVVRAVIALPPLGALEVRKLCVGRVEAAGYRLDTAGLINSSVFGGDKSVDEERGVHLFFRLLAETSAGNPSVALRLWLQCLHGTDDPKVLMVHSGDALDTGVVPNLNDAALFTLVALRVQDVLDEQEVVEVTNLPTPVVRSTVRDLIARGLVSSDGETLCIPEVLLPAVTRTLRRRHFLHLGAA